MCARWRLILPSTSRVTVFVDANVLASPVPRTMLYLLAPLAGYRLVYSPLVETEAGRHQKVGHVPVVTFAPAVGLDAGPRQRRQPAPGRYGSEGQARPRGRDQSRCSVRGDRQCSALRRPRPGSEPAERSSSGAVSRPPQHRRQQPGGSGCDWCRPERANHAIRCPSMSRRSRYTCRPVRRLPGPVRHITPRHHSQAAHHRVPWPRCVRCVLLRSPRAGGLCHNCHASITPPP